jgi:hypothetical protein
MLEGLTPPKNLGHTCKIDTLAQDMSESDRKIFLAAIDDKETWPAKTLSRELRKRGVETSDQPILLHRTQQCRCFRD